MAIFKSLVFLCLIVCVTSSSHYSKGGSDYLAWMVGCIIIFIWVLVICCCCLRLKTTLSQNRRQDIAINPHTLPAFDTVNPPAYPDDPPKYDDVIHAYSLPSYNEACATGQTVSDNPSSEPPQYPVESSTPSEPCPNHPICTDVSTSNPLTLRISSLPSHPP